MVVPGSDSPCLRRTSLLVQPALLAVAAASSFEESWSIKAGNSTMAALRPFVDAVNCRRAN